jgi:hypothetical protein
MAGRNLPMTKCLKQEAVDREIGALIKGSSYDIAANRK